MTMGRARKGRTAGFGVRLLPRKVVVVGAGDVGDPAAVHPPEIEGVPVRNTTIPTKQGNRWINQHHSVIIITKSARRITVGKAKTKENGNETIATVVTRGPRT